MRLVRGLSPAATDSDLILLKYVSQFQGVCILNEKRPVRNEINIHHSSQFCVAKFAFKVLLVCNGFKMILL